MYTNNSKYITVKCFWTLVSADFHNLLNLVIQPRQEYIQVNSPKPTAMFVLSFFVQCH